MIEHSGLKLCLDMFSREERARQDPTIAILGPGGCGKSRLLSSLLEAIKQRSPSERNWLTISVDLYGINFASEGVVYREICDRLVTASHSAGSRVDLPKGDPAACFKSMVKKLTLGAPSGTLLCFDHFEYLSASFALELSQSLRALRESSDEWPSLGRLGLIVAGSLSLNALNGSEMSAFHTARVLKLPIVNSDVVRNYVRESIETANIVDKDGVLCGLIAEATGCDDGFIEPLIREARRAIAIGKPLQDILDCYRAITLEDSPYLRDSSLQICLNDGLREIVARLCDGERVNRRSQTLDIDSYQLTGVITLEEASERGRRNECYRWRNGLMNRLAAEMLKNAPRILLSDSLQETLTLIQGLEERLASAVDLDECETLLRKVWQELVNLGSPLLFIAISNDDIKNCEIIPVAQEGRSIPPAIYATLAKAGTTSKEYIDSDGQFLIHVFQLQSELRTRGWMIAYVDSTGFDGMPRLQHWRSLISNQVASPLLKVVLAEFGASTIQRKKVGPANPVRREHNRGLAELYIDLNSSFAIAMTESEAIRMEGRLESKWAERAHKHDLDLLRGEKTKEAFEELIEKCGADVLRVLEDVKGLPECLTSSTDMHSWVITSSVDCLKLHFELLHSESDTMPLLLKTGVARRLLGVKLPHSTAKTISALIDRLRQSSQPLNMLIVGSDPSGELDTDGESNRIKAVVDSCCKALGVQPNVIQVRSEFASAAEVERKLLEIRPLHFFHFCGHGFVNGGGRPQIQFNKRGLVEVISSDQIKTWLLDSGLWLSYFSACQTAAVARGSIITTGSFIEDIVNAGIPNYVGFRWPITATSSRLFAETFYRNLFEAPLGCSPIVAMMFARRAAAGALEFGDAWASSILVTQCPHH